MTDTCRIHPAAHVDPTAELGEGVKIGPFAVVEAGVVIGDRCQIEAHAVIKTGTRLGSDNYVGHGAVLGGAPQHRQPPPRIGQLWIGDWNTFRECVTVHRALHEGHQTRIGHRCIVMVGAHVAHDCRLADDVILANNVLLAGHVTVGRRAYLSGAVAVHQFCRIGSLAMVGGQAHVNQDVPPCVTVDGATSCVVGLNIIGLRRAGVDAEVIRRLKEAYRMVYRSASPRQQVLSELASIVHCEPGALDGEFYEFLKTSQRGFLRERHWQRRTLLRIAEQDGTSAEDATPAPSAHTRREAA